MIFSLYPTDHKDIWDAIVIQAKEFQCTELYCSLHIPEAKNLRQFLRYLKTLHTSEGFTFIADISPHVSKMLNLRFDQLPQLMEYGIKSVRVDFGYSEDEVIALAHAGFRVAINASTISKESLERFKELDLIGWHNYYPRPETGISKSYMLQQNQLLRSYGIPIVTFIPGESYWRAPFYASLPTLESQRALNTYVNYLEMRQLASDSDICLAEGVLQEDHKLWIRRYDTEQVLTLPVSVLDSMKEQFYHSYFPIRKEVSEMSWRLDHTRALFQAPNYYLNTNKRAKASIQMDLEGYGRYQGELHIMKQDATLHPLVTRVGAILEPYENLVDFIESELKICFHVM